MFNERLQMDLLFWDDIIALRNMDVFSKYSNLARARSKNPQEVWGAFLSSWVGVFGAPKSLHFDEGGEWGSDLWRDLCVGRRVKPVFQGVGAHLRISEHRNGSARGIYKPTGRPLLRWVADPDRSAAAPAYHGLRDWILCLPIGSRIQSD